MNTVTQNSSIFGLWAFCFSRCAAGGAHFMPRTLSKCTRTFVSARFVSPEVLSTKMGSNLSKG